MAKKVVKSEADDLRSRLKPTAIKNLRKVVEEDNVMIGASSNEYLNLEDGKTLKIRIYPSMNPDENFYIAKKSYWLSVAKRDGEMGRTTVLDSVVHGGTEMDIVDEYIKTIRKKFAGNAAILDLLTAEKDALAPTYSWVAYASKVDGDEKLKPCIWEFKKMVRDALNKLAMSEDEGEEIEIDPFTDPDEGLPVLVKYNKKPDRKRGENYYEVNFSKKPVARPLSDDEIVEFLKMKPLSDVVNHYTINDFKKALEGVQNFDEENQIGLFEDDEWLDVVEKIRAQYDDDNEEEDKPTKKVATKKVATKKVATKKVEEEVEEEDVEEEVEEEDVEEDVEEEVEEGDEFDEMDREDLKRYIKKNNLDVTVKKSWDDDKIREEVRAAINETPEEAEEAEEAEEDEEKSKKPLKPSGGLSIDEIRKKLSGK